jgi:hypothetical protein
MKTPTWLRPLRTRLTGRPATRTARRVPRRLDVEALEDRTAPASFQGLGSLEAGGFSSAAAVSADGSVVVGWSSSELGQQAVRWEAEQGAMEPLGILPGGYDSQARGVTLVAAFDPFGGDFSGGGFVAAADIDGDGRAEFVVTPDQGGGPRVSIFSLADGAATLRANFFGIDDPAFRGGASAALGDVNGDGTPDLAVAAGYLGGPRTALFDGTTLFGTPARLVGDFFAFPGPDAATLRNGVFVAAGDVDGDGRADLVAGGGPGGGPRVLALSGADLIGGNLANPTALANFFAGNPDNRGGVRVAVKDLDGDPRADLVVGDGDGAGSRVTGYYGKAFADGAAPEAFGFDAFPGLSGGVFVG